MSRLRTLGGVALVAVFIAGLTGCGGSRMGDLGSEQNLAPVVKTVPVVPETASAETPKAGEQPAAEAVDLSETAEARLNGEYVAMARNADEKPAPETAAAHPSSAAAETKDGPAPAGTADVPKPQDPPVAQPQPKETPSPAPAPAPVPAPTVTEETPEQRAARLLSEAKRLAGVQTQAQLAEAEAAYQAGLKAFNDLDYEEAGKLFERAVALDPANGLAQQKLRTVRALLGIRAETLGSMARELEEAERVKIQGALVSLGVSLEEARTLEERGSAEVVEGTAEEKERGLQEELDNLQRAQDRYRRVKEIINWMPPTMDLPAARLQVDEALTRVRDKIAQKQDALSYLRRVEAQRQVEDQRVRQTELFKERISKMLDEVRYLYDRNDFKGAERLAIRILQLDPFNSAAESWKSRARSAYHANEQERTATLLHQETVRVWDDVAESTISYGPLLQYPSNWDEISKRSEKGLSKKTELESWKQEIKKKLQRKVTFDFVDTPLDDAIKFLRDLANVTMIVDPKVMAAQPAPVTLRVQDMSLDLALDWILKMGDLTYTLQDHAIFISKQGAQQEPAELRIYDVTDLTLSVPDFPGPELQLVTPGDEQNPGGGGGGAAAGGFGVAQAPAVQAPTLTSIADMIRNRVQPKSWDPALGTSIEERGGRLVVMQKPEVHDLIEQLLSNFRATQKMMINIESRFLQIRESYLEDTGVEFQGLDPNVLTGDFGDVRRLGGPGQFIQPRTPGNTESNNVPFPGMVNGPDRLLGGTFSEVGSIVTHQTSLFSNDPDTISGLDASGRVVQGGLSAQVTVLNNLQTQAFIKALAVRENATTLTAPRLTVFNTQRANMFVAQQQSYIGDYNISGDSYDPIIRQFLTGVVLDVRPIVSSDRRYVTLEMRPTVTSLISFTTRQIDSITINNGGANGASLVIPLSFPIQFPDLSIQRVRTTATVPDGGILLLAGLYRNVKFHAENGVPFLSDLPVVGRLFRWDTVENAKSNLAILVSPRIILFSEEEEKL